MLKQTHRNKLPYSHKASGIYAKNAAVKNHFQKQAKMKAGQNSVVYSAHTYELSTDDTVWIVSVILF